jgi:hypothetical protein
VLGPACLLLGYPGRQSERTRVSLLVFPTLPFLYSQSAAVVYSTHLIKGIKKSVPASVDRTLAVVYMRERLC